MNAKQITASDIFSAITVAESIRLAKEVWRDGNNTGNGFTPDDDIADIDPEISGDGFDIYRIDDDALIVADAHGPWGVRIG